jgi:hypothetical protein
MAKDKVTITLDRAKAEQARSFLGTSSTSQTIDVALDRLIRQERIKRDIEAYTRIPPTDDEISLASYHATGDIDDTDWEALYAEPK